MMVVVVMVVVVCVCGGCDVACEHPVRSIEARAHVCKVDSSRHLVTQKK
jgi:hypothetical protein